MRDNYYFRSFIKSLSEDQKADYRERSINQQKDWYISYLENHFQPNTTEEKADTHFSAWRFVEKYYPDYSRCGEIAQNDDLQKLVDDDYEEGDHAHQLLLSQYGGDLQNPQIEIDLTASNCYIYQTAIENFMILEEDRWTE